MKTLWPENISVVAGVGRESDYEGHRGIWGVKKLFYILIELVITYLFVKTLRTVK